MTCLFSNTKTIGAAQRKGRAVFFLTLRRPLIQPFPIPTLTMIP